MIFVFLNIFLINVQNLVGGLLGVGVDVLRPVDLESNMDVGGLSNMVGYVLERVQEANHVLLKDVYQVQ